MVEASEGQHQIDTTTGALEQEGANNVFQDIVEGMCVVAKNKEK